MKFKVGLGSLRNYQRMPYTLWYAVGELVDNSIQAYFDNKKELDKRLKKDKKKFEIKIFHDKDAQTLSVWDNASGITKERIAEAFDIGSEFDRDNPEEALGQFNVGLKAAAIWLCDEWTIKTKRFDADKELEMVVVNESVFQGEDEIPEQWNNVSNVNRHYTGLTFEKLRKVHSHQAIKKTKIFLASMYRRHLNKSVSIFWNDERLEWNDFPLAKRDDGKEYRWLFGPGELTGDGQKREVRGWLGVLEKGNAAAAGISIIRRGRMIQGYPDSWRPRTIFASGRGSLINQRVIGEIEFDQGSVSYDKSSISPDELDILEVFLGSLFVDENIARVANRTLRDEVPSDPEEDSKDLDDTQKIIEDSNLSDISNQPIPAEDIIEKRIDNTFKTAQKKEIKVFNIKNYKIELVTDYLSEEKPFIAYKYEKKDLIRAVVNMEHPYITNGFVTKTDYFLFIVLMLASRYKIETDERYTMNDYFDVLDNMMRLQIKRK